MKIYTKTGDQGETGLFGGPRVRKDHPRIEAYGEIDELNAVLGLVRAEAPPPDVDGLLAEIQNLLFDVGAELATPEPERMGTAGISAAHVGRIEAAIDQYEARLPPLKAFILPGGTRVAAGLHLARTVCRRAERRLVLLAALEPISQPLMIYVNRLSDLLFVLAREANRAAGRPDVCWEKQTRGD
ncbi:MAG TPA: cob(I)yrinic acid a,c-diamide adenosyltransferase [Pirellulales bacterium]|nr:cob(I)yrinic acid a,c-diamide adenosyltransferase [Pirellulales bacterium]